MMRHNSFVDALGGTGAVIAAYCGIAILWSVASTVSIVIRQDTGGIDAVSAGAGLLLPLVLVACLVANRLLAGAARRSGGVILELHRAQSVALMLGLALVAGLLLLLVLSLVPVITLIAAAATSGILFGLQFLLLAAMLVAFIWRRRTTTTAA